MREALSRRCARIVSGEYPAPDLLVIDGGKGQVGVAAEVLAEQGLHTTRLGGFPPWDFWSQSNARPAAVRGKRRAQGIIAN